MTWVGRAGGRAALAARGRPSPTAGGKQGGEGRIGSQPRPRPCPGGRGGGRPPWRRGRRPWCVGGRGWRVCAAVTARAGGARTGPRCVRGAGASGARRGELQKSEGKNAFTLLLSDRGSAGARRSLVEWWFVSVKSSFSLFFSPSLSLTTPRRPSRTSLTDNVRTERRSGRPPLSPSSLSVTLSLSPPLFTPFSRRPPCPAQRGTRTAAPRSGGRNPTGPAARPGGTRPAASTPRRRTPH